jgi:hypothetical protein
MRTIRSLRSLLIWCAIALGLGIAVPPLGVTLGFTVVALTAVVDQQLAQPHAPNLPLEGRSEAHRASGRG